MKLFLGDGRAIEANTADELMEMAAKMGFSELAKRQLGPTYYSKSKKREVLIAEMDVRWARNAAAKLLREWAAHAPMDPELFVEYILDGPEDYNSTFSELVKHIARECD